MKQRYAALVIALLATSIAAPAGFPPDAMAATPEFTGETQVPGTGHKVRYRATAKKNPETNTATITITVWNSEADEGAFSFIACAMLQVHGEAQSMPQYIISKKGQTWQCEREGHVMRRPGFHMGCKMVTVPANGGKATIFNVVTPPLSADLTETDLGSIYWDLLQPCPIRNCDVGGVNVNLSPRILSGIIANTVNVWGANWFGCKGESLHCSIARWDAGNWVTMNYLHDYPARLMGEISGLDPGSSAAISLPDASTFLAVADSTGILKLDIPFRHLANMPDAFGELKITPTRFSPDGTTISLHASVVGDAGNPHYKVGQFMYAVDQTIVWDSTPPTINSIEVERSELEGQLIFRLNAADATTLPAGATVRIKTANDEEQNYPLAVSRIDTDSGIAEFELRAGPFKSGTVLDYDAFVEDELGNRTQSEMRSFTMP